LDEEHEDLPQDGDDADLFYARAVGKHNVVLACRSAGQTPIQMKVSFSSVQYGFMIGIGGGVRSVEADFRLGDVVVSQPEEGHGG
jgi:nucleoside phosphorylase